MASKDGFDFALRSDTAGELKSELWKAWSSKDDVYIAQKSTSGLLKVSLHSSGICSFSLTQELMSHAPPIATGNRKIIGWSRQPTSGLNHVKVLEMNFVLVRGGLSRSAARQPRYLLPDAPTGFRTELSVFYSNTNPVAWSDPIWPVSNILHVFSLASGQYACFRRRVTQLSDEEFQRVLKIQTQQHAMMVVGEKNPEVISAGNSAAILSEAYPFLGVIHSIEPIDLSLMMGTRAHWSTQYGNRPKQN